MYSYILLDSDLAFAGGGVMSVGRKQEVIDGYPNT